MNERVRAAFLLVCESLSGWHHGFARERRTAVDFAYEVGWLLSKSPYKDVSKVWLVVDNLNTHVVSLFYKAFSAVKARDLARRLEFYYMPKYGNWLNIVEISISILSKQCIDKRLSDLELLNWEVGAWEEGYNSRRRVVKWQFTADDAR
ncbi:MAG: transposase, partial [Nitrososphaerota archaeon]|nr:transposase [Nitrososphaerota archaeon]